MRAEPSRKRRSLPKISTNLVTISPHGAILYWYIAQCPMNQLGIEQTRLPTIFWKNIRHWPLQMSAVLLPERRALSTALERVGNIYWSTSSTGMWLENIITRSRTHSHKSHSCTFVTDSLWMNHTCHTGDNPGISENVYHRQHVRASTPGINFDTENTYFAYYW
jgi:hypothetical protein